jgi:hypothetical protein
MYKKHLINNAFIKWVILGWDFLGEKCFTFETRKSHLFLFFAKNGENIFLKKNYGHKKICAQKVARP